MSSHFENSKEDARHERAISALTRRTGVPLAEVRALFAEKFAQLSRGATVRSYLVALTMSNVLTALRVKGQQSGGRSSMPDSQRFPQALKEA